MPLTPVYNFPYPALASAPDIPADFAALALALDGEFARIDADLADAIAEQKPHAILRATAAQSIPTATFTALNFNVEDYDSHSAHSTVSNTSRYVCPKAGAYGFGGGLAFAANVTGSRTTRWAKNGAAISGSAGAGYLGSATSTIAARPIVVRLDVGDYVELQCYQSSGGALNTAVSPAENQPGMSVYYLSP